MITFLKTKKVLLLTFPLIALAFGARAQTQEVEKVSVPETWWFNVPSSPLIFDYEPKQNSRSKKIDKRGKWLILKNGSNKNITRFILGCVTNNQGKVKVIGNAGFASDRKGQKPGEFVEAFLDTDPTENERFGKGLCVMSKVSVVKVFFKDGSSWSAEGIEWLESPK
ncbi:MAG TPA: hypothetical protein VE732_07375 [Nitrososphaera sp.]|nr:hypothetical protein [Nitrososphaera sp.]